MSSQPAQQQNGWSPVIVAALLSAIIGGVVALLVSNHQTEQSEKRMKQEADLSEKRMNLETEQFRLKLDKDLKDAEDLRKRELAQRVKDFQLKFYEKQMAIYQQLMEISGKIIAKEDEATVRDEFERLNTILLTDLVMVADSDVVRATIEFHKAVGKYQKLKSKPDTPAGTLREQWFESRNLAWQVAVECRKSLRRAFELPPTQFGDLPPSFQPK